MPGLCSSFGKSSLFSNKNPDFQLNVLPVIMDILKVPVIVLLLDKALQVLLRGLCICGELQTLNWIPVIPTVFMQEIALIWALRQGINLQFLESCIPTKTWVTNRRGPQLHTYLANGPLVDCVTRDLWLFPPFFKEWNNGAPPCLLTVSEQGSMVKVFSADVTNCIKAPWDNRST